MNAAAKPRGSRKAVAAVEEAGPTAPERILTAATACFSDQGFAGTSTRQLAAAAGVNIAALAYHFGGKEGVYQAVIDRLYQQLLALDAPLPTQGTPAWRASLVIRAAYRFARAHQAEVRLLLRHVLDHGALPDRVLEWTTRTLDRAQRLWRDLGLEPDPAWKLKLLTLNHLIVRYAISRDEDLAPFVGSKAQAQARVEEHLVQVAFGLLGIED